ncbi:hypothetical protein D3C76_644060 [compost metagenome]
MNINVDNFVAVNDKRPGQESFKVFGTVNVGHPGIEPLLVEPSIRHKGGWEVLNLELRDNGGIHLQVVTRKTVHFERAGGSAWQAVEINHPGGKSTIKIVTVE